MPSRLTRRRLLQSRELRRAGPIPRGASTAAPLRHHRSFPRMPGEGQGHAQDLPRRSTERVDEAGMRRLKQIGVDYVLTGGPRMPWTEEDVRGRIDRFKAGGLTLFNMMISGLQRRDLGKAGSRCADRAGDCLDPRRGQGRPAGHRIQLLREPTDGGLQGGDRPRGGRLHGVRLRALEGPAARKRVSARTHAPSSSSAPSTS